MSVNNRTERIFLSEVGVADRVLAKTEVKIFDDVQTPGGIGRVVGFVRRDGFTSVIVNHAPKTGVRPGDLTQIVYYPPTAVEVLS